MEKHKILIIGAGKIGVTVAALLARSGDYIAYLGDINVPQLLPQINNNPIQFTHADIKKPNEIKNFIIDHHIDGIVSCLPYNLTLAVAKIASECGIHYFDPTEDIATTTLVSELAQKSKGSFAPQSGLAPGFISITASSLMQGFDEIDHVKMRVGALTQNTSNSLHYAFTWSVDGVINEYINPCVTIQNNERVLAPALGGLESIVVNNDHYEAFHTSGGIGSLVDSYYGKVKNMDYKTLRYPGHCNKMSFVLQDLRLRETPELAKQILSKVIPYTEQDKVVIYVSVQGYKNGILTETSYTNTLYPSNVDGNNFTAIQMTTSSSICAIIDMVLHDKILSGLVKQEQILLQDFLVNRFGMYYAQGAKL